YLCLAVTLSGQTKFVAMGHPVERKSRKNGQYETFTQSNGIKLYNHGGTPSEFYGKDIYQLEEIEASLKINIKEEKKKDQKV
ncbi:hypothetical protein, partial [Endozoicomonas sp. YOMI1]|uniref:hypothetical protein n=1 Tax=Endozoicomonas sp. YOMI1 TaxID=2828739 RepID=UPI002147961E